jgi:hypothetical protein
MGDKTVRSNLPVRVCLPCEEATQYEMILGRAATPVERAALSRPGRAVLRGVTDGSPTVQVYWVGDGDQDGDPVVELARRAPAYRGADHLVVLPSLDGLGAKRTAKTPAKTTAEPPTDHRQPGTLPPPPPAREPHVSPWAPPTANLTTLTSPPAEARSAAAAADAVTLLDGEATTGQVAEVLGVSRETARSRLRAAAALHLVALDESRPGRPVWRTIGTR